MSDEDPLKLNDWEVNSMIVRKPQWVKEDYSIAGDNHLISAGY